MFWVCIFDLSRLKQSNAKINLKDVLTTLQLISNIQPVHDPHVVAFENRLSVELDSGECIEPIESEHVPDTILLRGNLR